MRGAACRGHNPELFFPIGNAGPALTQVEQAKRICRGCPALEGCAAWVAANPQDDGIWAATTPAERRALTGASERTAA
ncbi:WhiB family transcriptional regulator [Nonomuraea roseoviolacea]|uniref:WhiB family transcriptional regulator n=1 Tax=Nonomuraea roseoviolacea TaxID=103837 RepID=UPI0020A3D33A|nr:WhiB family transcriptional regulator [Nonomuraea roseoviolacea]